MVSSRVANWVRLGLVLLALGSIALVVGYFRHEQNAELATYLLVIGMMAIWSGALIVGQVTGILGIRCLYVCKHGWCTLVVPMCFCTFPTSCMYTSKQKALSTEYAPLPRSEEDEGGGGAEDVEQHAAREPPLHDPVRDELQEDRVNVPILLLTRQQHQQHHNHVVRVGHEDDAIANANRLT